MEKTINSPDNDLSRNYNVNLRIFKNKTLILSFWRFMHFSSNFFFFTLWNLKHDWRISQRNTRKKDTRIQERYNARHYIENDIFTRTWCDIFSKNVVIPVIAR